MGLRGLFIHFMRLNLTINVFVGAGVQVGSETGCTVGARLDGDGVQRRRSSPFVRPSRRGRGGGGKRRRGGRQRGGRRPADVDVYDRR